MYYQEQKMNKAPSSIKNDLGKLIVDIALTKVDVWAKKELDYIRHAIDYPACIPLTGNSWIIGKYNIKNLEEHKNLCAIDRKIIHVFYSKKASILYAVFEKMRKYELSDALLEKDKTLARIYDDLKFYEHKIKLHKADSFKAQLYESRYTEARQKFKHALKELEKSLTDAKYIKVWDKIL